MLKRVLWWGGAILLLAAGALLVAEGASASTTVPGGTLSADTTWTAGGSPYVLTGDLTVASDVILTVDPGVAVQVDGGYSIYVFGGLRAAANASAPVSFGPGPNANQWGSLELNGPNRTSFLLNVTIDNPTVGIRVIGPGLKFNVTDVRIVNASSAGIRLQSATTSVSFARVTVLDSAQGVDVSSSNNVTFVGLTLRGQKGISVSNSQELTFRGLALNGTTDVGPVYSGFYAVNSLGLRVLNSTMRPYRAPGGTYSAAIFWNTVFNSRVDNLTTINGTYDDTTGGGNLVSNSSLTGPGPGIIDFNFGGPHRAENTFVCGEDRAMQIWGSSGSVVENITSCTGNNGITILQSSGVVVRNSTLIGGPVGIEIDTTSSVLIQGNTIRNATVGIRVLGSGSGNLIFENSILSCPTRAFDGNSGSTATWYNATKRHGNYYDDYAGSDIDGDLVGDTPYNISGGSAQDLYPLMIPYDERAPVARIVVPNPVNEDTPVYLDGSSSSDDRGIVRAVWTLVLPSQNVTLTGLTVWFTFPDPEVAQLQLRVYDAWNHSGLNVTTLTVRDITRPVLTNVSPFVVPEGTPVLQSVNATDNDPNWPAGASYGWRLAGGWGGVNLSGNATSPQLNFTFTTPGVYNATIFARDRAGNEGSTRFQVTVLDTTPPTFTFNAITNATVLENDTVAFEMANAADLDPAFPYVGAFQWTCTGPNGFFVGSANFRVTFRVPSPGNYNVNYRARDPSGNERAGNLTFEALDAFAPRWTPPADFTARDVDAINLSAASAIDASGVTSVNWTDGGLPLGQGINLTVTLARPGVHPIGVVLGDPHGHTATYGFRITILDTTAPWVVDPAANASRRVNQSEELQLDISGAVQDNDLGFPANGNFTWTANAARANWTSPTNGPAATVRFPDTGRFNLTVRVKDAAGNALVVVIPVEVLDSTAPSGLKAKVSPPSPVTLGAAYNFSASASDESPIAYQWDFGDGSPGQTGSNASHAYAVPGNYTATVTATDARGNAAQAFVDVRVLAAPQQPNGANPPENQTNQTTPPVDLSTPLPFANPLVWGLLAAVAAAAAGLLVIARRRGASSRPAAPPATPRSPVAPPADPEATRRAEYEKMYGRPPP